MFDFGLNFFARNVTFVRVTFKIIISRISTIQSVAMFKLLDKTVK